MLLVDKFIMIVMTLLFCVNIITIGYMYHNNMEVLGYIKTTLDYANKSTEFSSRYYETELEGQYLSNKYFCVWTEGKTPNQINYTYCHESCHDMVYKDTEHFCEIG